MAAADDTQRKNSFGDAAAANANPAVTAIPSSAPAKMPTASGGAVFGLYPQLADNRKTLYATGDKLRAGISADGPAAFSPAGRIQSLTPASPTSNYRLDATTDPRSTTFGGAPTAAAAAPAVNLEPTPGAQTDVQRPIASLAAAPAPVTAAPPPALSGVPTGIPGVQKTVGPDGRVLYSDGNAASDASLMARGRISGLNMQAGDNLAATSDKASMGRIRAEQFAKEAAAAQVVNQAMNDRFNPQSRGQISALQLRQAQQKIDNQQGQFDTTIGLTRQKQGVDATTAGLDQRGKIQLLAAQDALTRAKTPDERSAAEDNLRALQGRYERPVANRFTVVPGGQSVDPASGAIIREPSMVINNDTGQPVSMTPPGPKLPPGMTRQVGTSNGKPVYEDASGKRFQGN